MVAFFHAEDYIPAEEYKHHSQAIVSKKLGNAKLRRSDLLCIFNINLIMQDLTVFR